MSNKWPDSTTHDPNRMARPVYQRIHMVVRQIPFGRVATYGQIAAIAGDCTPRMVGYAMAALPQGSDVPWHRVINAQGKISPRGDGGGAIEQRRRLQDEGVVFDAQGKLPLNQVRWSGPELGWLLENGFDPGPTWREE